VLFVDELEVRLHPLPTKVLVGLFNSAANTGNTQLVYVTHDEGLLEPTRTRRDPVWFVEKDPFGASRLHRLDEFKGVRRKPGSRRSTCSDSSGVFRAWGILRRLSTLLSAKPKGLDTEGIQPSPHQILDRAHQVGESDDH
jgi:hypothetical protein